MTLSLDELEQVLANAASYKEQQDQHLTVPGADLVGLNNGRTVYQQGEKRCSNAEYIIHVMSLFTKGFRKRQKAL
jgi:hypothetical protein